MINELYHFGIKGMKWGVRRYQNKDGTLTKAGRRRAQKDANSLSKAMANLTHQSKSNLSQCLKIKLVGIKEDKKCFT